MSKKRKIRRADIDDVEKQEETETEDIYDDEQREQMLDDDEIAAAENAFMRGREVKPEQRKTKKLIHDDSVSFELAEGDYSED